MLLLLVTLNAGCCLLALWLFRALWQGRMVPAKPASFAACLAAEAPPPVATGPAGQEDLQC